MAGTAAESGSRGAEEAGQAAGAASREAEASGESQDAGARVAELAGQSAAVASRGAEAAGIGTTSGERAADEHGQAAASDGRPADEWGEAHSPRTASVTIDHTKVTGDLTDFQLYVNLAGMGSDFWAHVANGGGDIRCYGADGSELAREVVSCDTATQTGELWVKVPAVSSSVDTVISIAYGSGAADYAPTDPYGTHAVWGANAKYVGHFEGDANDSSASVKNLTTVNGPALVQSKIGNGYALDGVNQYLTLQSTNPMVPSDHGITLSAWVYRQTAVTARKWLLTKAYGSSSGNRSGSIDVENLAPRMTIVDTSGANHQAISSVILPLNAWTHVCGTYDITTGDVRIYLNGVLTGTGNNPMKDTISGSSRFYVGTEYDTGTPVYFFGKISDVKVLQEPLSSALIAAEYANQSDPATFYSIGTGEDARMAEIAGQSSGGEGRAAEAAGQADADAGRSAEEDGEAVAVGSRTAEAHGQYSDDDGRSAELAGEATIDDGRSAELHGEGPGAGERMSETSGQSSSGASRWAEEEGADGVSASRAAEEHGEGASEASRPAEEAGESASASWRGAEERGQADASESRSAEASGYALDASSRQVETAGINGADGERGAEEAGEAGSSSDREAEAWGVDAGSASRAAEEEGIASASASRSAETDGIAAWSGERNAEEAGAAYGSSSRGCETAGMGAATSRGGVVLTTRETRAVI